MERKTAAKLFTFLLVIGIILVVCSWSLGQWAGDRFVYLSADHMADTAKVIMFCVNVEISAQIIGGILTLVSGMGILCIASGHWQEPE